MSPHSPGRLAVPPTARRVIARATLAAMADPSGVPVDIRDLLAHTRPAYGGRTWAAALPVLMRDLAYSRVVHDLVADLEAGVPIVEPVWAPTRRGGRLRNGMHRLTAHLLAGTGTVLATTSPSRDTVEIVELSGTLAPIPGANIDPALAAEVEEDGPFAVLMHLMSLRVGPVWASSDGAGNTGPEWFAWYYVPHAYRDDLARTVTDRAAELGYALTITKVTLSTSTD